MAARRPADDDPPPAPGCAVGPAGHLVCGGCDAVELAERFGTPLYVFDEVVIRDRCRAWRRALAACAGGASVAYAAKAALTRALAAIMAAEEMHLDVVSPGEVHTALGGGFPAGRMYFHGNNKTAEEIEFALEAGVGRFVVDNFHELDLLDAAARRRGRRQPVLLRVAPGIEAHTHEYIRTGGQESKFGFDLASGQAAEAARRCAAAQGLTLYGLHAHVGSQILETTVLAPLVDALCDLGAQVARELDLPLRELNLGGGAGIRYTAERPPSPAEVGATMAAEVARAAAERDLPPPRLIVEPGRAIIGEAAVALYRVGAQKRVPGLAPWVAVDGGMGDNIRPALYGAQYRVAAANRMRDPAEEVVQVVGRYCESGDFLAKAAHVPRLRAGDLLAFFSAGAYQYPMASNYNRVPRPALLLVSGGQAHVMVERETLADLDARDRLPPHLRG